MTNSDDSYSTQSYDSILCSSSSETSERTSVSTSSCDTSCISRDYYSSDSESSEDSDKDLEKDEEIEVNFLEMMHNRSVSNDHNSTLQADNLFLDSQYGETGNGEYYVGLATAVASPFTDTFDFEKNDSQEINLMPVVTKSRSQSSMEITNSKMPHEHHDENSSINEWHLEQRSPSFSKQNLLPFMDGNNVPKEIECAQVSTIDHSHSNFSNDRNGKKKLMDHEHNYNVTNDVRSSRTSENNCSNYGQLELKSFSFTDRENPIEMSSIVEPELSLSHLKPSNFSRKSEVYHSCNITAAKSSSEQSSITTKKTRRVTFSDQELEPLTVGRNRHRRTSSDGVLQRASSLRSTSSSSASAVSYSTKSTSRQRQNERDNTGMDIVVDSADLKQSSSSPPKKRYNKDYKARDQIVEAMETKCFNSTMSQNPSRIFSKESRQDINVAECFSKYIPCSIELDHSVLSFRQPLDPNESIKTPKKSHCTLPDDLKSNGKKTSKTHKKHHFGTVQKEYTCAQHLGKYLSHSRATKHDSKNNIYDSVPKSIFTCSKPSTIETNDWLTFKDHEHGIKYPENEYYRKTVKDHFNKEKMDETLLKRIKKIQQSFDVSIEDINHESGFNESLSDMSLNTDMNKKKDRNYYNINYRKSEISWPSDSEKNVQTFSCESKSCMEKPKQQKRSKNMNKSLSNSRVLSRNDIEKYGSIESREDDVTSIKGTPFIAGPKETIVVKGKNKQRGKLRKQHHYKKKCMSNTAQLISMEEISDWENRFVETCCKNTFSF